MPPRALVCDLDNTLAKSKAPITPEMAMLLAELLEHVPVSIISGGALLQLATQAADQLPEGTDYSKLYLQPTSGAALFSHNNGIWEAVYEENLSQTEMTFIAERIEEAVEKTGVIDSTTPAHGPRIEFRGAQVSFSALGQQAPLSEKEVWDADRAKRRTLVETLAPLLPDYDVKSGGLTTIDITRRGVNKAFGVRKLADHLSIPVSDMLYVGDALYPGGNDAIVRETEIQTKEVENPDDTVTFFRSLLAGWA